MHLLFGTNSLCLFAQPLLFLASVLHLKLTFSVLRINNYFPASVVSQKAPLIICAYIRVRLIEMQYIIIIIIIFITYATLSNPPHRTVNHCSDKYLPVHATPP
jgi:hypothetical protein